MKVAHLSYCDYSNFAYNQHKALLSVGVESRCVKLKPHTFEYHEQAEIVSVQGMADAATWADVIIIYHSHRHVLNIVNNFVNKKDKTRAVIAFHTGSIYRNAPDETKALFDSYGCVLHLTDQCEFLLPENHGLVYHAAAIDTDYIKQFRVDRSGREKPVFAHYPSKPDVKGSPDIIRMMQEIGVPLVYSEETVSHEQQLRRMAECDVYIELFKPELNGKPYGCFGVTAFEAAALGCNVITQCCNLRAYWAEYSFVPMMALAYDETAFSDIVNAAKHMNTPEEMTGWIEKYHSLPATGHRLKEILQKL